MNRRSILLLLLAWLFVAPGFVCGQESLVRADELYDGELHREGYDYLRSAVTGAASSTERAELLWRLSRVTMEVGDLEESEGAPESTLLARYEEGEGYADRSIELNPENFEAYYWKSANIGRWGETKGILNSLFRAKPMRDLLSKVLSLNPGHAASYYVLGIMYEKLPGWPISFGSVDYGVSLARKSIDANAAEIAGGLEDEVKLSHYMELARHLWARNWDAKKRNQVRADHAKQYAKQSDVLEKHLHYEGIVEIPNVSDREEALSVIRWVISEFEAKPSLTRSQRDDLAEARDDLASWTQ
jgi:tetratricopeptide (TPR) repeat protein